MESKIIIIENVRNTERVEDHRSLRETIVCKGDNLMEASDGSHTFAELYQHRYRLFISLCHIITSVDFAEWAREGPEIWRSTKHADGSMFDGYFIMGISKTPGKMITYHLPLIYWGETEFADTLENAPEWDGHASGDILERLKVMVNDCL